MFKRLFVLFWVIITVVPVLAQNVPDPITAALQDLSTRVNRTVTLTQVTEWNYQQSVYPSPALGCPQPGIAYTDVLTSGYQFIITYEQTVYDYRVSDDKSIVVLCGTAPAPSSVPPCPPQNDPTFVIPRLGKGVKAQVIAGGLPNVIREQPGSSSKLLGQIPPGDPFIVIDGPRCTLLDKIVWWQINYNNLIGWTGEGQGADYWLEPADIALTPTAPAPENAVITPANAAQLSVVFANNGPLTISPDGTLYAWTTNDANDSIVVSDSSTQAQVAIFAEDGAKATSLAFNLAGTILAAGMENGEILFFDLTAKSLTGGVERRLTGHTGAVTAVAFNRDGTLIASVSADKTLRVWDSTGTIFILNITSATVNRLVFTDDGINLIAYDPNGNNLIYAVKTDAVG